VFRAVAEEVGKVLEVDFADLWRFDEDTSAEQVASWAAGGSSDSGAASSGGFAVALLVRETGRAARTDDDASGSVTIGSPVVVDGSMWGVMSVCRLGGAPLPADAEHRLRSFTELVATAISNATTHSQLLASRARIVAAADEARRRVERNLHDGTQQRLISLGLDLQVLESSLPADARQDLSRIRREVDAVIDDVREVSRGLHPALLAEGGLAPALSALARRSPIPVELDVGEIGRCAEPIEIAVYYVVSEALANAAKHSGASVVYVKVWLRDGVVRATVADDGGGGAQPGTGSGLTGLIDRVEALGGHLSLVSPPGAGTTLSAELPLPASADGHAERSRGESV
jgi:signal transduction histidine kinase